VLVEPGSHRWSGTPGSMAAGTTSVPPDPDAHPRPTRVAAAARPTTPALVTSALSEEPIGFRQVYLANHP